MSSSQRIGYSHEGSHFSISRLRDIDDRSRRIKPDAAAGWSDGESVANFRSAFVDSMTRVGEAVKLTDAFALEMSEKIELTLKDLAAANQDARENVTKLLTEVENTDVGHELTGLGHGADGSRPSSGGPAPTKASIQDIMSGRAPGGRSSGPRPPTRGSGS